MKFNYFLGLGIFLSLTGASLLVALGILYVKPYLYTRHFSEGRCNITSTDYTKDYVKCQCSSDGSSQCESYYSCISVIVQLLTPHDGWSKNITLYDSYETYTLHRDHHKCSYHKCSRYGTENKNAVAKFEERMETAKGSLFSCFYEESGLSIYTKELNASESLSAWNVEFVLLDVVDLATVVNSIFWPSLSLVVGFVIFSVEICRASSGRGNVSGKQRSPFSSLERQLARIKDRSYSHHHRIASERLVCSDRVDEVGHVAHVIG